MKELKHPNSNPWYVLMTLYGEQLGEQIDSDLAKRNRQVWNAWSCQGLTDAEAAAAAEKTKIDYSETRNWDCISLEVVALHRKEMEKRNDIKNAGHNILPEYCKKVDLSGMEFENMLFGKGFIFTQDLEVSYSEFKNSIDFPESLFLRNVNFSNTIFSLSANFYGAAFRKSAYFYRAVFTQIGNFSLVNFSSTVDFSRSQFFQTSGFERTSFENNALFTYAEFSKSTNFSFCKFMGIGGFIGTKFRGPVKFQEAQFVNDAIEGFDGFLEPSSIDFTDSLFESPTSFQNAVFKRAFPIFAGASLHEKTNFSARIENWPSSTSQSFTEARESCSTIRHALAGQGLPEDEHFFFRLEMELSLKALVSAQDAVWPYFDAWPYWVFKKSSGYGESIARPVMILLALWVIPALILFCHFAWIKVLYGSVWSVSDAWTLSFANIFYVFGFHRLYFDVFQIQELNWVLQLMGAFQTIFALPLIFLVGLGFRKRFRLR